MKRSVLMKLGLLLGLAASSGAQAQVFNVHDIQHGYFFYGGYNAMAFGQGAAADPGNNIWNGFGNGSGPGSTCSFGSGRPNDLLLPNNPGNPYAWASTPFFAHGTSLFSPANFSAGGAGNATSAGGLSPVTIPIMKFGFSSGATTSLSPSGTYPSQAATTRTNVPLMIFSEEAVVNAGSPGAGTAANPMGLLVLSNVPPGTYDVYLYGANSDGTRGGLFVVDSGTPTNGITGTTNSGAPQTDFQLGVDYTVFNNVTPNADSTIQVMWGAVANAASGLSGEGDFNGLQLVPGHSVPSAPIIIEPLVPSASAIFPQGATATLPATARGNPALAYQWYSGSLPGTPVAGQTNRSLSFSGASASQSGNYFFVATNIYGAVTGSVTSLTIAASPLIVAQSTTTSSNAVVLYGGHNHFALSITAFGDSTQPLSCYWQSNGITTAVTTTTGSGGTSSYQWVNTSGSANYSCIVSNSFGTASTGTALAVTVVPAPVNPYASAMLGLNPFAYWPLSETSMTFTYDYVSGNNGAPNSTADYSVGQPGPTTGFGASSTAYAFDGTLSGVVVPGANLNFSGPITLITWVLATPTSTFETLVGKGDSSYRINIGTTGIARFNDAGGTEAIGGPFMESGAWHQVVGTFTGSNINLYVDGALVASGKDTSTPGNNLNFYIGGAPDYTGRFMQGSLAHVAILTNALSGAQVSALFQAGHTPPFIATQPTNLTGFVGGHVALVAAATGATPLTYQWTGPAGVIAGATNSTLLVSNLTANPSANNGPGTYYVTITNPYGVTNSPSDGSVQLSVNVSQPFFVQDLPSVIYGIVGSPLVLAAGEGGNSPITNQWFYGASSPPTTALHDVGRIGGSATATLTITNLQISDQGYYQVLATNGVAPYSAASQIAQVIVESEPLFNSTGLGWTFNGPVANINQNLLTLTDGNNGETSSAFFDTPVYVGAFVTTFTYTATNGTSTGLADGATFCLQNDPAGTAALGGGGGSLGYAGITQSAALALDLYNATPGGIEFASGGFNPNDGQYTLSTPVALNNGHPINVTLRYDGQVLAVKLADTIVATNIFMTNIVIGPISQYVGSDSALIGFTAATGGVNSIQTIGNFTYTPLAMLAASRSGNNIVVTWPVGVGGYVLQKSSSLTSPSWTTIAGPYGVVGSSVQATVPVSSGSQFYRLQLQ